MRHVVGKGVRGALFLLAFSTSLGAAPAPAKPLAVLWVGEEPPNGSVPHVDIAQVQRAYESRGYRILRADALAPETLRALVTADRSAHAKDYGTGAEVTLVIHGRATPPGASEPVRDEQIVGAFLDGIGHFAKGEILSSACFSGVPCRELDVAKTPLEGRVSRLIVAVPQLAPVVAMSAPEKPEEKVLSDLLDVLVSHTILGEMERQRSHWRSAGPLGELERLARGKAVSPAAAPAAPLALPDGSLLSLGAAGGAVGAPAVAKPSAPPKTPGDSLVAGTPGQGTALADSIAAAAGQAPPRAALAGETPAASAPPDAAAPVADAPVAARDAGPGAPPTKPTEVPRTAILSTLRPIEAK